MQSEIKIIEAELEDTKAAIKRDWDAIGTAMTDRIDQVKLAVEETKESVRASVNIKIQTKKHPIEMVAGALTVGFIIGAFILTKGKLRPIAKLAALSAPALLPPGNRASAKLTQILSPFKDEIGVLKGVVAATLIQKAAEAISRAVPGWRASLEQCSRNVADKIAHRDSEARLDRPLSSYSTSGLDRA